MTEILVPQPLTKKDFADFGDVIETEGAHSFMINQGTTERFHNLAQVDTLRHRGVPIISIFRGERRCYPLQLEIMERHPIASQAFYPLTPQPWLVVVADVELKKFKAFIASGHQGVNYAANTWHHPLLVLEPCQEFLIIDRGAAIDSNGKEEEKSLNLEEHYLTNGPTIKAL